MKVPPEAENNKIPPGSALNKNHNSLLFKQATYKSIKLHNRIGVSPMCKYSLNRPKVLNLIFQYHDDKLNSQFTQFVFNILRYVQL